MTHKLHNTEQYRDHAEAVVKSDINTSLNSLNSVEAHSIIEAYKPQFETISSSTIKEKNLLRLAIYANLIDSNNIGNVIVERDWILSNMKATQILINTIQPNGLSYWVDQDWKINKDGRGEFRTWEDGIYGKITQNCLKELFWLHIPLSATARPTTTAETSKPAQVEKTDASLALISSTLPEGVSQQQALELAYEQIGKPLTTKKIQAYQVQHNISIDTKNIRVWAETYGEMYAKVIEKKLRDDMAHGFISKELQWEILTLFWYANLQWKNISGALLPYIYLIQREAKDSYKKDRFEIIYWDFFKILEWKVRKYSEDPNNIEQAVKKFETKNKSGGSLWWDLVKVFKQEMEVKELFDRNKWTALIAGIAAFIFFGNKIPGFEKIPWMGSWFGRIAWLIGWAMLGGGELIKYWIEKVWDGISAWNAYVRSPEAKGHYQAGEDWIVWVWDTLTDSETYGKGTDAVRKIFNTTIWSMESANEALKATDAGKYIEWFTGKSSIILSDASFLNTPKSQITGISNLKELEAIMTAEGYKKLIDTHKMSDSDVRNFISQHMSSRLKDAKDTDIVRQTIFGASVVLEAKQALLDSSKNFNTNPAINTSIKTDLSNILNGSGSETYKQAGTNLWIALQTWTLDQFSLEAYKSLWSTEKSKLDTLLKRLLAIQTVQEYIENQVLRVNAVEIKTEWLADTPTTLTEDFVKLEKIKTDFALNTSHVSESWINENDYETSAFEMAYAAKRQEILEYAAAPKRDDWTWWLGLTAIWSVKDIEAELGKAEREKEAIELEQDIDSLIDTITDLPPVDAPALELRSWWDENESELSSLKEKKAENSGNTALVAKIDEALKVEAKFIQRYKEVREDIKKKVVQFSKNLKEIQSKPVDTPDDFGNRQSEILEFIVSHNALLNTLDSENTWHIKTIWKDLFSGNFTTLTASSESIAIYDLDSKLKLDWLDDVWLVLLREELRKTVREVEKKFSVDIWIDSVDIANPTTIAEAVKKLKRLNAIVDRWGLIFANPDVLKEKRNLISDQISALNTKFVNALNKAKTPDELGDIYSRYRVFLEWEFSSTWEDIKKSVGYSTDPVIEKYGEMQDEVTKIELEEKREPVLKLDYNDDKVGTILSDLVDFMQSSSGNEEVENIMNLLTTTITKYNDWDPKSKEKKPDLPTIWDIIKALETIDDKWLTKEILEKVYTKIDSLI